MEALVINFDQDKCKEHVCRGCVRPTHGIKKIFIRKTLTYVLDEVHQSNLEPLPPKSSLLKLLATKL